MAATVDDVPQSQSALTEKVEQEERDLLTSSGIAIEELLQVEKKVQALTEESHETVKANSQVDITNESIAGNSEHRDGEQFSISPIPVEIDGEKNTSSSQVHNGEDMTNGVNREKSKTHLISEEGLQYQEVEIIGASVPRAEPNAEESRDLNKDEATCIVQEDTIMASQEATSAQTTRIEDHLDATQDIIQEVEIRVKGASVPGTQLDVEESRDLNKDEAICVVQEDTIMASQVATSAQATGIEDHLDATQDKIQEVEITVTGASVPGTQLNVEESRDLNKDEAICVVQEDTIMESQEATSAQAPGIEDHLDAKLLVTGNQGADQQNISNTPTASFQDPHEVGLQIEKEMDTAISSNLDSKKMEPQELNSSQRVEDETTEEVQRSLALTRDFPSGIVCKSDQTEMGKEESQDTEALAHTVHLEDEPTEKIDQLRDVSTETEYKGSRCSETTGKNSQDAEMLPFSVTVRYETTKEVESLCEHTGNVSAETECGKENRETSEGNPQDAERVIQSTDIDNETMKKVEIPPELAEDVSFGMESVPDDCEMIEGNFEDHTTLLHSAILEDETTEKVESLSEQTRIVSIETECCSDPTEVSKANTQDAENFLHSVNVQNENTESINTEDGSNYIEAKKEEISDDVEMNTLGAESGKISFEVKSTDDGKENEILESERSDLGSANVAVSSTGNYPNKSEKEEVENSSHEEQVSSPMISAFTGEILLEDVGPEKVQEIEAHSGTIFEKEEGETEDTSEPALVKEVPDMVPIVAKENQAEIEKQNMFLEDVATENSTASAIGKAKEMPESSSNDLVMEKRETLGNESQEQVPVELLAGEGIHDEVSKGLTETNIEVEVPVKPEISSTKKDPEAFLPKNEPGKENRNEFLQEASGPLEKIDSCQHSERTISVQEQRSTELLEGDLCEEKDSISNASKSKADNSLHENTMADGSNKEVDNAVPDDTAQETYETEETQYNDSEERGTPQSKEDKIAAEVVYKDFCKDEEKEMQIIDKDEVTKEYLIEASVAAKNKSGHQVRTEAMNHETDDIHEGEAVYRNDDKDIKGIDSMEGALELKEDQISAKQEIQVDRDTSEKDDKMETQIIDEEEVDTALESSFKEEKLSDLEITSEITNQEADEVHKKEIEGNSVEEVPEPKEYQIAAEEDTFNKDDEETKRIIDEQEMATESLIESSNTEENKLHYKLETEPINPEADDIHKQEAFFSNDDEKMKGHIEERASDLKEDQITAGEAPKDIFNNDGKKGPQQTDKEVAVTKYLAEEEKSDHEVTTEIKTPEADEFHEGEEIKGNDSEEVTKPEDQGAAEVHKDTFSKAEEKEMKMMDKSGPKVMAEETITEADELQKAKSDQIKDDEDPKGNYSEEEVPEPNDHIAAEEIRKETFSMDEVKEAQIIDKEEVATEHSEGLTEEEDNKSSHEVSEKETHPETDDVHKGEAVYRNGDEREPGLRNYQILDEEACQDTFSKDENKDTKIEGKMAEAIEYLGESYAANLNKSDHEITTTATNQGDDDEEEIIGNDPEEIAAEQKVDQIAAKEVMQAQKDKICKDAEIETQIIEEQEVATEYSVDSHAADFNKSDDKATNSKADDVDKREAVCRNDDEKIKGIDSEKGAPGQKYHIFAEEVRKDEEENAEIIEKWEVAIEYSVESIAVEENMSNHMDKIEVTNPDSDEFHKGKADHPNDGEETQDNDPQKVATEQNEDRMTDKEAYENMSSKEDRGEVVTECLVESSVVEKEKSDHKETNREVSGIRYDVENQDSLEETTTQNELQEPVSEDITADKILTLVPSLEKLKEEFEPERHIVTYSAEEMKAEDSCEESQRAELNREGERLVEESLKKEEPNVTEPETETKDVDTEGTSENDKAAYTTQEEEKEKVKHEGNAGVSAGTDRLAEGLSPRKYQDQPENSNAAPNTSEKNKDTVELAKMQPVEGSLKKEEQDVLELHEQGTEDAGTESIINNDEVTHSAQGREIDIIIQGNAEVLAEGLPPGEYQEQAANFLRELENSEERKEEVLDTKVPKEIRLFEGSLKQEERDSMEPRKETKELDTTENDDATLITQECGRGNPDAASTQSLKEKVPLRENEKIDENSSLVPDISEETKRIMIDTTESAEVRPLEKALKQEEWVITEQEKETRDLHVECITQDDDAKHTAESSSRMTDTSKEWNEKTLDTEELTETRPVEGTLEQKERVVMEQEIETKDLHIEVTTQNDEASHSTEEGEKMICKHEENINAAGTSKIAEEFPTREYQEQLGNSSEVPEDSKKSREKMPDTMEQVVITSVERSMKQDEWDVLEPEKEEAEMKNIMHEANADFARDTKDSTILTEALPPREYQGLVKNLNPEPKISEQSKEKILDTTVSTEIRLVEGNLKQEDWDVMRPEKEEKNLDREDTVQNDEATLSVKGAEKDTIKPEGHPEDAGTDTLGEEFIARKHQELAKTSSEVPDIFKQRNEKILDTKESTEARPVEETLKQEEQAKDSHVERTTENNEAINSAQEGQTETVKNERNLEAADTHGLMEGLVAREYQELAGTSIVVPNISEEINETILDSIGAKEIKLVEGISKQTEWDVMGPEKETKDLDGKDTIKKDEVTLTAKQGEKDMVEHARNPDASGTEKLPPREYYEELAEHSSVAVSKVAEVRNDKLLDATEKEKDEDTFSSMASQKDTIKGEGNPDDAGTSGLTDELPTREYEELAGNSRMLPDISKERNENLLEITESIGINSVEGILKQKEWEVKGQEKETKDLHEEVRTQNDDAMHSAKDSENVVTNKENANVADENRLGEELIPREHQELDENSSALPDNSDISKDKMSEITESTEIIQAEISKQEEWYVIEPEKEIRNLDRESTNQNDVMLSAHDGEKEMVKLKGHQDAQGTGMLIEGLALRECLELPEIAIAMPEIPESRKEKILESEMIQGEEGLKQEEWHVMQPEKEIQYLDKGTTLKDKATISAQEGGKESSNYAGIPDAAVIDRLTEGLPSREYQELAENSSAGEEWDAIKSEKETKDLDSTTQKDETTLPIGEAEKETVKHEGNQYVAGTNRLTEGFSPGQYQELAENSIVVANTSEERDKKLVDAIGSIVMNPIEGISKQDKWNIKEPEKETKDCHIEETKQNDQVTHSAQEVGNMEIKHQGNANAAGMDRLAEEFPHQELNENFIVVPEMSEEENEKMIDITESKVIVPVEGSLKQDEGDVLEPQKKIKDMDIEDTIMDKEATHLALEGEKITHEGYTISTVRVSEGLSQREYKELAENSSAMPEVFEKSKEKMLDNTEPTEIAVQVQEILQLDNNTPTPEKVDQEDAPKPEVQPRSNTVDSHSGNTITEVKILKETDKCSKVPSRKTDKESQAQENIDRKDTEVNSSSASTAYLVDVTVIESPEQLKESMVSEDKPAQAVNETIEDDKKDEDVAKVETNTLSLLEHETPHYSPNESTCNILKKNKIINLEEQEDNTEKAGSLLTGTSEREQINATEKTEQNHLMLETGSTQEVNAKAQGSSSRDDEKQQMVETVPLKTEKLEITEFQKSIPEKVDSTERKKVSQLQEETITRNSDAVGDNPELSEVKPEVEAPHWEEKGEHEETTLASMPRDASPHDLLQTSKKDISWVTDDFLPETETYVAKVEVKDVQTEKAQNEEPITDEEGEGDEDKRKESAYESPVKVEAPSDIDVKAAQKKSHNILSGVGSKVKQSIKKVKKAITGKSSHPKPSSPK